MSTVSAEAVDAFAAAKASLVGMKTVMKGVSSSAAVMFRASVSETKVVSPVDSAVVERGEGKVKKLWIGLVWGYFIIGRSTRLWIEERVGPCLPVSGVNQATGVRIISAENTDVVSQT